jgi:Gram-negative bacterial TonB protein C-terminal
MMKKKNIIKVYKRVRFFSLLFLIILTSICYSQEEASNKSIDYKHLIKKPLKDTAFIILPEIFITRDTIIVDEKSGALKSCLAFRPAKLFNSLDEYKTFVNSYLHSDFVDDDLKGLVLVQFLIYSDGSISNISILKKLKNEADKTVVHFIKSMKKWIPAKNKKNKYLCTIGYLKVNFDIIVDKRKPNKVMESQIKY